MIDDQVVLEMAQSIDVNRIYERLYKLLGVKWGVDLNLATKKMEIVFSNDESTAEYLETLTEAHNQMLFLI